MPVSVSIAGHVPPTADACSTSFWDAYGPVGEDGSQIAPMGIQELSAIPASFIAMQSTPTSVHISPTLFDGPPVEASLDRYWGGGVRDRAAVSAFFAERGALFGVLAEAEAEIRKRFPWSPITLEVFQDPEAHDSQTLFISVLTGLDADSARERLHAFDHEWWIPNIARANGDLAIGLEFI